MVPAGCFQSSDKICKRERGRRERPEGEVPEAGCPRTREGLERLSERRWSVAMNIARYKHSAARDRFSIASTTLTLATDGFLFRSVPADLVRLDPSE